MSDVAIAPDTAPPAPAPVNEVPVNPNPVNAPAPIGNQAPPKPEGETERKPPVSRREGIQRAFERAEASRPKVEPRKAKIGDNNPPEEIDREKPAINLRRPPSDQPQRGEHGHFAPREQKGDTVAPPVQHGVTPAQQPARQHPQLPDGTPYQHPPQRLHERAKSEWAATPESVRGEVHRMQTEFQRAYERYRPDVETFNTIRHFADMAAQQGTTLERALTAYTSMEGKLRQDPFAGFDTITYNLNLRPDGDPNGPRLTFADICWAYLNQTPDQRKLTQNQNHQTAQSQQIGQLHQMVNQLATGMQRMHYERQFAHTRSQLDRYADAHPRFDELGPLIEQEIKLGFNLDQAYRRAEMLRPATHAAQTRTPSAQTRPTGRSISGAPAGPSNGTGRRPDKPVSRRDAIANAMKRASNSL